MLWHRRPGASALQAWPAAALALAAAAWGSTFVVNRAALDAVGPFTILSLRFVAALAVLGVVAGVRRVGMRSALQPRLLLLGVPLAAHFGTQTAGLAYTTASRGAIIVAAIPVAVAVAAALTLHERLRKGVAAGILLSLVNVSDSSFVSARPGAGRRARSGR